MQVALLPDLSREEFLLILGVYNYSCLGEISGHYCLFRRIRLDC
jgi:hypothetical protein